MDEHPLHALYLGTKHGAVAALPACLNQAGGRADEPAGAAVALAARLVGRLAGDR